jgi:hypothetical protein
MLQAYRDQSRYRRCARGSNARNALAGLSPGAPKGNKNAFKHGCYSAEAIATRRKVGALLRAARKLVRQADDCGSA